MLLSSAPPVPRAVSLGNGAVPNKGRKLRPDGAL